MERITVTITADTHDMGAQVLEHLDKWVSCMGVNGELTIMVEDTSSPPYTLQRELDEFLVHLRSEGA